LFIHLYQLMFRICVDYDQLPRAEGSKSRPNRNDAVDEVSNRSDAVALAEKLAFLGCGEAYGLPPQLVSCRETHMSWVFFAGDRVFKLKKPVQFSYLNFSTLERREFACRKELELNRRLARDVYLDVLPLTFDGSRFSLGGSGKAVDWLVVMKRLDEHLTLETLIDKRRLERADLDRLCETLSHFYRSAAPINLPPDTYLEGWRQSLNYNRRVLLDARFRLPQGLVRRIDQIQRRFLQQRRESIIMRLLHRRIIDGHGDLRPEHIWLGQEVCIIDCLEFNDRLRVVDPFDEVAFLGMECHRLGAAWAGTYLQRRLRQLLRDGPVDELFIFYYSHRAMLRARLAIAHLFETQPRTPEKWPVLARTYLRLADQSARQLERMLRTP
jgi:aminoglycoside phosphotransferase family enzyme